MDVISGPPDLKLDDGVGHIRLPGLDLYNPEDLFRMPTLKELADPINLIEWLGVSSMGFPEPFTFGLRAYNYLRSKHRRYDIVHDNQCLSYGISAISKLVPTIATIHHPITMDRKIAVKAAPCFWGKLKQLRWYSFVGMQKRVARALTHVITVSRCAQKDIGQAFKIPLQRFSVVPNGIDTALFCPQSEVARDENRIIVTNSADTPLKGLSYLLKAVARIAAIRNIKLVVIGTPQKNGPVVKLIRQLHIKHLVKFTGRISEQALVRHYARATVAVVPSVYEGFGLPAGEAMACGLPVVSTWAGALPEVVGDAGLLVPPADYRALARAILSLLDNPVRARQLGTAGLKRVRRMFSWKRAAEETVETYKKVIRAYNRF